MTRNATLIHTTAAVRAIEQAALAQGMPLMARAGEAAANVADRLLGQLQPAGRRVLVVAGPGNNGGDALECALHLKRRFYRITVVLAGDPARLPADAARALHAWESAGGMVLADMPANADWDLVIDGLFGIGLSRAPAGPQAALIERINALQRPVLALDIPSGLHSDTGAAPGCAVRASHTLTFIARKPGLYTLDGPDHCGTVSCATLGTESVPCPLPAGALLDTGVRTALVPRPANFHKGMAGDVGIIGGAPGMVGAPLISGRAALAAGAGRVFVGLLAEAAPAWDPLQPELMLRAPADLLGTCRVLALGPGMGTGPRAARLLQEALRGDATLVLDADALNLVAAKGTLTRLFGRRAAPTLLTPHPAEAARLLDCTTAAVQGDRLASALAMAQRFRALVLLKGNGSVLAAPDGRWWINPTGNPGMASAGMGDALTGLLAGLLGQRIEASAALQLAVWAHGRAGDALVAASEGPLGITATAVIHAARRVLNRHQPDTTAP